MAVEEARLKIQQLKSIWSSKEDGDRRRQSQLRKDYYDGQQYKYLHKEEAETNKHWYRKKKFLPNIVKESMDILSYLYDSDPERKILQQTAANPDEDAFDESAEEFFKTKLWEFGDTLTMIMGDIDPMIRLLGQVNVMVQLKDGKTPRTIGTYLGEPTEGDSSGFDLVTVMPHNMTVLPNKKDPRFAEAVLIRAYEEGFDDEDSVENTWIYHYYDKDYFAQIKVTGDDWFKASNIMILETQDPTTGEMKQFIEHNFGCIPMVELRDKRVSEKYWVDPIGGYDLIISLNTIRDLWMQTIRGAILSVGQMYVKGKYKITGDLGLDTILNLIDADGQLQVLNRAIPLIEQNTIVETSLNAISKSLGLPDGTFTFKNEAKSGLALQYERQNLVDDRKKRQQLAQMWERGIHSLCSKIYETIEGETVESNVFIKFAPFKPTLTPDQALSKTKFLFEIGAVSSTRAAMMVEPGLTEQQADIWRQERLDEQSEQQQQALQAKEQLTELEIKKERAKDPFGAILSEPVEEQE